MAKGKRAANDSPRISNRRALHDYFISAKIECGMALVGSEVKSLRAGKAQLQDAYAHIENGELYLHGAHIDPYEKAALVYNHDPRRPRKLLLHRREIKQLDEKVSQRGMTLVPLSLYFADGKVKLELALAKGKEGPDKRRATAERDAKRQLEREVKERYRR
jgi:SsrA-binding protein